MAQQFSPQPETLVSEALRSGGYPSPNEVIDRDNRDAIDTKIYRGIEEERGEGIPEDETDSYLAWLKAQPE